MEMEERQYPEARNRKAAKFRAFEFPWLLAECCAVLWAISSPSILGAPPAASSIHPVLSPADAIATFRLPDGFKIELVAAEPDIVNPMTMVLDERNRIYVSLAHTYRYGAEGAPIDPPSNPIVRLELDDAGLVGPPAVVASGFTDPVMGLAVQGDRLWATNLDHLFTATLGERGQADRRQTIVQDAEKPWNPFGMYRVVIGPDGLIYFCVGDHPIKLTGPSNKMTVRGSTGGVFRCKPDGSDIELLIQGVRAPFAFDMDPYGRMYVLSNGEGNPNRLIQAIPGGDYHFQTRSVDWSWLAGKDPLAPPVWENPPGAHTAVLAYYSSAFPKEYWGNLLVSNWGVHGFPSANHVILRHVLDERGEVVKTEPFLTTTDPRFRPTQITLAPDGNLYVLDWYGMDDENDLTGRLYKVTYVGTDAAEQPAPSTLAAASGLASRHHRTRQLARQALIAEGPLAADKLAEQLAQPDPLAAAESLWTLRRNGLPNAAASMSKGLRHPDWRVRRLAVQLLRDQGASPEWIEFATDPEPAVRLEVAVGLPVGRTRLDAVIQSLRAGAAAIPGLRYRAALEVARLGEQSDFEQLLTDSDLDVRLAGLIALDEAFHEETRSEAARAALIALILEPGSAPLAELFAIAQRWPNASFAQPVISALKGDLSVLEVVRGLAVLRRLNLPLTRETWGDALNQFFSRAAKEEVALDTRVEKIETLAILALEPIQPNTLALLRRLIRDKDPEVRAEAHYALTARGVGNQDCIQLCWRLLAEPEAPLEYRLEAIVSLTQIEQQLSSPAWLELLASPSREVALVALRSLRNHVDQAAVTGLLAQEAARLAARGAEFDAALKQAREPAVAISAGGQKSLVQLYALEKDPAAVRRKESLRARLLDSRTQGNPLLGRLVFRSQVCSRCHRSTAQAEFAGPPLDGVAATNPVEYLVDSVLFPSKTIKTGFMLELIVTRGGQVLVGGAAREGEDLVVTSPDGTADRVALKDVERRQAMNRSLMPESLEITMSEPELRDLIAYLATLRDPPSSSGKPIPKTPKGS